MTTTDDPRWLSTGAAAERLGINTRTLYRLIDQGAVPAYKMGRVLRLQQQDLDAFIVEARVEPGDLRHLYDPDAPRPDDDEGDSDGD